MATPTQNNLISLQLSAREKQVLDAAFTEIESILGPKLVALTPEGMQELPRMGKATVAFVGKALEYARAHPALVPQFIDLNEMEVDFSAANALAEYIRRLTVLTAGVSDTATLSGSEAYSAALGFYNNVRFAAKNNIPGAQAIYSDLSERFPGRPTKKVKDPAASA